jgi:predicted esterase
VPADGPDVLRALVNDAAARVPRVDPQRTYLFGHSAGGVFALYMGLVQPEFFAAAVAHAAAFAGEVDAARLPRVSRPVPLLLLFRAGDEIYQIEQARTTTALLNEAGCRAEMRLLDGGHSYGSPDAERVNELAWQFLRGQRLATAPRFLEYRSIAR